MSSSGALHLSTTVTSGACLSEIRLTVLNILVSAEPAIKTRVSLLIKGEIVDLKNLLPFLEIANKPLGP